MNEPFKLNDAAFREQFRLRLLRSQSELSRTVNRVAYAVANAAIANTVVADKSAIERLGVTGYRFASKTGKRLKTPKPIYAAMRKMRDIVFGQLHKQNIGEWRKLLVQSRDERDAVVIKAFLARRRNLGYLRSGWVPIRNAFARAVGSTKGSEKGGRIKGRAVIAQPGFNPEAIMVNFTQPQGPRESVARRKLMEGFQKAIDQEAKSMAEYVAKHVKETYA